MVKNIKSSYEIIAARYEGNMTFGMFLYCTTSSETHAKAIVKALENSDEAAIFHFTYVERKTFDGNDNIVND